jgi:predicted DNA-binding transcriptional regulator YafY
MRASRLLSLLMLLQARRRVSAQALSDETGVSVRTVYRDMEHLGAAGVPVIVTRGSNGGFELLPGWSTRLTGLTPQEAQAMFLAGAPRAATQLGLGEALASSQLKLLAALPQGWQADARRVGSRFHLDPVNWHQSLSESQSLPAVAAAVWSDRRVRLRYQSWKAVVERVVSPLGLVSKAGDWYLVALADRGPRTYRLSSIEAVETLPQTFSRPRNFDLADYWAQSVATFESGVYTAEAELRVTQRGLTWLRRFSAVIASALEAQSPTPDATGWLQVRVPIESIDHAAGEFLRLGVEAEVLAPPALRAALKSTAAKLGAIYMTGAARSRARPRRR